RSSRNRYLPKLTSFLPRSAGTKLRPKWVNRSAQEIDMSEATQKREAQGRRQSPMSARVKMRRLSCFGMSASPPTSDVWLRRSELTLRADFVEEVGDQFEIKRSGHSNALDCEPLMVSGWVR